MIEATLHICRCYLLSARDGLAWLWEYGPSLIILAGIAGFLYLIWLVVWGKPVS